MYNFHSSVNERKIQIKYLSTHFFCFVGKRWGRVPMGGIAKMAGSNWRIPRIHSLRVYTTLHSNIHHIQTLSAPNTYWATSLHLAPYCASQSQSTQNTTLSVICVALCRYLSNVAVLQCRHVSSANTKRHEKEALCFGDGGFPKRWKPNNLDLKRAYLIWGPGYILCWNKRAALLLHVGSTSRKRPSHSGRKQNITMSSDVMVYPKRETRSSKMAKGKTSDGDKYSILLPTYNERENLPIIIWLICNYMDNRYVFLLVSRL